MKKLKIVSRGIDKYVASIIYGYVYDTRKINMDKINEQFKRKYKKKSK